MDPVSIVLMAASIGGGLMQAQGGRRVIDPKWLAAKFGAHAITAEAQELFNNFINSPAGTQMLAQADQSAAQFRTATASAAGQAGMGGDASSGASIFSNAAATSAAGNLEGKVRSDAYGRSIGLAADDVAAQRDAYVQGYYNTPSASQTFGSQLGNAASAALVAHMTSGQTPTAKTTAAPVAPVYGPGTIYTRPASPTPTGLRPMQSEGYQYPMSGPVATTPMASTRRRGFVPKLRF